MKYINTEDLAQEALDEIEREAMLHYHLRHTNIVELLCFNTDRNKGSRVTACATFPWGDGRPWASTSLTFHCLCAGWWVVH